MSFSERVLKNTERALYRLRDLYQGYGYARYKVSKFEEYDLYAHNKSFLVSERILSFTDTDGRLMALKPDVTLSIVKNVDDGELSAHKLYYNETVYRTSADSEGFREIMQTGLECIGRIDLYAMGEVLMLAQKSLALISDDYILDVSHMGFLSGLLEEIGVDGADAQKLLGYIGNKNTPAIKSFCQSRGIGGDEAELICRVTDLYAPLSDALAIVQPFVKGTAMTNAYEQMCGVAEMLKTYGCAERVYLDFSIVNDMNYYNGIIFRGFVNGIPDGVLSGGRYDSLIRKMGKQGEAIGFAVYLDQLERYGNDESKFDTDVLLVYDDTTDPVAVMRAADELRKSNDRVLAQCGDAGNIRYRTLYRMCEGGMIREAND